MTPLPLAELPDPGYIFLGCLIVAIAGLLGLWLIIRTLQSLRAGLAKELRQEMDAAREAIPVAAQQPFIVKPHEPLVTREEWSTADRNMHGRLSRERQEIEQRIERVEKAATERANKLEGKLDTNTQLTASMSGEVKQINQSVQLILNRLSK